MFLDEDTDWVGVAELLTDSYCVSAGAGAQAASVLDHLRSHPK